MNQPQRKSPRLGGYDYSQTGVYFVTICTHKRRHLFGNIVDGQMMLSTLGQLTAQAIDTLSTHWIHIKVDVYVVMPNHLHAILVLDNTAAEGTHSVGTLPPLGCIIGLFKAGVTRLAREKSLLDESSALWQGRYHDHIVRNEADLERIRAYIERNPTCWSQDTFFS
jgi:REP element-mobilizing transposase RayT